MFRTSNSSKLKPSQLPVSEGYSWELVCAQPMERDYLVSMSYGRQRTLVWKNQTVPLS